MWIKVFFQTQKFMVNSGIVPPTSFVLIWIDIVSSLNHFPQWKLLPLTISIVRNRNVNMPITASPPGLLALADSSDGDEEESECLVLNASLPAPDIPRHQLCCGGQLLPHLHHFLIFAASCGWASTIPCLKAASLGSQGMTQGLKRRSPPILMTTVHTGASSSESECDST